MADFGTLCLLIALACCGWAILASYQGWRTGSGPLVRSAERAVLTTWALTALGVASLEYCIHTDRFDLQYVASYSNRTPPRLYKGAAPWAEVGGTMASSAGGASGHGFRWRMPR